MTIRCSACGEGLTSAGEAREADVVQVARPRARPSYKPESARFPVAPRPRLAGASDVWLAARDLADAHVEHFVGFFLDVRHRVIERRTIAVGSLTGVEVHPRDVFRPAIAAGAAAIICVHNHPSGEPTPSRQDVELTMRLREVGELVGIAVLDHVVVGREGYASLAERSWT